MPLTLACKICKPSVTRSIEKGVPSKRIYKCTQPWVSKWASHRELEKLIFHQQLNNYLEKINIDGDILTESRIYNNDVSN